MKQEIYVREMPKSCAGCKFFDQYIHDHDKELVAKQINTIEGIFCHFINELKGTKFDERMIFVKLQLLKQHIIDQIQKEFEK